MATAVVQEQQLLKTLRWYDGFVIALANPGFLLALAAVLRRRPRRLGRGDPLGDLGRRRRLHQHDLLRARDDVPREVRRPRALRPRGVAQVHDARRADRDLRLLDRLVGRPRRPTASSSARSSRGRGSRASRAAATSPRTATSRSAADRGRAPALRSRSASSSRVWLFNVFGARVGVTFGYVAGVLLMVPLFVMMILPFLNGSFDSANLTNNLGDSGLAWGGLQLALVWLWLMCWSAWGVDVCATFAPEYKDTVRDTKLALRSAALFSMVVYIVLPIGFVGGAGAKLVDGLRLRRRRWTTIVGSTRAHGLLRRLSRRELHHHDEHGDRRRRSRALRDLAGRHDDQAARDAEQVQRAGNAMTIDMVVNILLRPLHRQHLRHPGGEQPRLRAGAHVRALGLRAPAQGPAELAAPDQAAGDLDADRRDPRRLVPDPDDRRLRLVRHRRRRLRRHEGEGDRRRRARGRPAALLLPAHRAGQGADPLA